MIFVFGFKNGIYESIFIKTSDRRKCEMMVQIFMVCQQRNKYLDF